MPYVRISPQGQITLPVELLRILGLKPGGLISFKSNKDGDIVVTNVDEDPPNPQENLEALRKAQEAFRGAAEEMGISNDEDVQALVNEVRYGSAH